MKTNQIITIVVVLLAVGFIGATVVMKGEAGGTQSDFAGKIEADHTFYDWGDIGTDVVRHTFKIKNTGEKDLLIQKISTSCGCTTAALKTKKGSTPRLGMDHGNLPLVNRSLSPNEEAEIEVFFDPLFHGNTRGLVKRAVYIRTSDPNNKELALNLRANVIP